MDPVPFSHYIWKWRAKKTRRWPKTGKTLLMGSSYLCVVIVYAHQPIASFANSASIDWSILCCCCVVDLSVHSGPPAEPTRYIQLLPRQHLSSYNQPECIKFPPHFTTPIYSTKLCHLCQRVLVLKPGDQHYLRSTRDVATAVGPTIP